VKGENTVAVRFYDEYGVRFRIHRGLYDEEDQEAIVWVDGDIVRHAYESVGLDDDEPELTVGRLAGCILDYEKALESGLGVVENASFGSQELAHVAEAVLMDDEEWWYLDGPMAGRDVSGNIVYLKSIEIDVDHRGKSLGLMAVRRFLDLFVGIDDVAVIKAYPLVKEGEELRLHAVERRRAAAPRLRAYWSRLGFVGVTDSEADPRWDYMYLPAGVVRPTVPLLFESSVGADREGSSQ
jgi:hypothetical protein